MRKKTNKGEKTLLGSLLLSAPGPLVTGCAALTSHSTTQLADFLRRTTELIAIFVSWFVYRILQRDSKPDMAKKTSLERAANLSVGLAMCLSGIAMLLITISNYYLHTGKGNVIPGLIIAFLGFITNTWFWFRYRSINRENYDAIIAVQHKLYRAKSFVDFCVVGALTTVAVAPNSPATRYVDIGGSVVVAVYLLVTGVNTLRKSPLIEREKGAGHNVS